MTLKVLARTRTRVTLAIGANAQVFMTIYTVPAGQRAYIKDILGTINSSSGAGGQYDIYVLKSGDTDLTTVATDTPADRRANTENKTIACVAVGLSMNNSSATEALDVIARNTILEAGDVLKVWCHYGAITPGDTDGTFSVSGDESAV